MKLIAAGLVWTTAAMVQAAESSEIDFCSMLIDATPERIAKCRAGGKRSAAWSQWLLWNLPPAVETQDGILFRFNAVLTLSYRLATLGIELPPEELQALEKRNDQLDQLREIDADAAAVYAEKLINGGHAYGSESN